MNNQTIKELILQRDTLYARAKKLDKAIDALREECPHDWSYDGHGHNEDYYICINCGKSKWV